MAYSIKRGDRYTGYFRDKNGVRLSAGTFSTEADALEAATLAESGASLSSYRLSMTLADYVDLWLPNSELLPMTKRSYESVLRTHVLPTLGRRKLSDIERVDVRDLLRKLARDGVSDSVRSHAKAALGSAFRELIDSDLLDTNPAHKVRVKSAPKKRRKVPEPDEFSRIVMHLPNDVAALFARFLVASGCRPGEATELRVGDVDFDTCEVYVERRVNDLGAARNNGARFRVIDGTKGGRARSFKVQQSVVDELRSYVDSFSLGTDDLLFPKSRVLQRATETDPSPADATFTVGTRTFTHGERSAYTHGKCRCTDCRRANREYRSSQRRMAGTPVRSAPANTTDHLPRDEWRRVWVSACEQAGIGWVPRTYDLRHANATIMLKNGVDLHEVKERLGHASITTTEGYLHRIKSNASMAADAVSDYV
jgi:integrase